MEGRWRINPIIFSLQQAVRTCQTIQRGGAYPSRAHTQADGRGMFVRRAVLALIAGSDQKHCSVVHINFVLPSEELQSTRRVPLVVESQGAALVC